MPIVEKPFRAMYASLFSLFALFGTSMTIIGATLPRILADFGWNYSVAGIVIGAGAVGYFLSVYASGFLVARFGPRATVAAGLCLEVAGLALFAATPSPLANTLLYLAVGFGQGGIELTVNWSTLRMDRSGSGRAMNLMHGAFAVGAFAGPFVISLLMRAALPWTYIYRGIAVLFALLLVSVFFLPFERLAEKAAAASDSSVGRPASAADGRSAYWFGFFSLFLYVGVEMGVSNWIAEYFVAAFGASPAAGSFAVSLFWAGLLAGRLGVPALYKGNRRDTLLLGAAALMAVSVAALAAIGYAAPSALVLAAAFAFLSGLGCSVVYPTVMVFVGGAFPGAQSQAIAFAAAGGGIGAFAFPFVMANVAAGWGIRTGFAAYAVFSFAVVVACAGLVRSARRS